MSKLENRDNCYLKQLFYFKNPTNSFINMKREWGRNMNNSFNPGLHTFKFYKVNSSGDLTK